MSSLSKVCVVGPSTRPDADIDYTFGQVLIDEARVDYSINCGNMSSATLMFVLARLLGGPPVRDGVALAFGPGLAAEGFGFRSAA